MWPALYRIILAVSSEYSIWPYIAYFPKGPFFEVGFIYGNGISIPKLLTRYLAENSILSVEFCHTSAGRLFASAKSENGKGTTTTSPFTNFSKLHPPLGLANPLRARIHLISPSPFFSLMLFPFPFKK